jgi:hypothetical protein
MPRSSDFKEATESESSAATEITVAAAARPVSPC